ncbi:MAG TPA: IS481 family transposase, partial [Thermoanaerobaculia bacterium]|nr:IS481 family transposase [Thermoanaerobaculia bacterium]
MPWKETDAMEQRRQFVVRGKLAGANVSLLCREFGISRQTGYRWLRRYEEVGCLAGLQERSRRPLHSPSRTSEAVEQRVEVLRQQYGWGGKKLQVLLGREGVELPSGTIDRILSRRGLVEPKVPARKATSRFEWPAPNDLWQMDFKGPLAGVGSGRCQPLSVLDDHSRYAVGLYAVPDLKAVSVERCLVESFERYGVPTAMLMDHGTPWWSTTNGHGLTQLSVWLIQQGIRLIYGAVGHPQTQGKVERFHRTLEASLGRRRLPEDPPALQAALAQFRGEYNHLRPHESLQMRVPAAVYTASQKRYQAQPAAWEYPAGSQVQRLNSAGCLEYQGHRYFVCEALAHQWVRCQEFAGHVLVSFRHMDIREIDLRAGR